MDLDDEICLCFHVSKRKIQNFLRVEKPRRAGQLSECFGAGTGCGWCRGYLRRMFDQAVAGGQTLPDDVTSEEYARLRTRYIRAGGGIPPAGATPLADATAEEQATEDRAGSNPASPAAPRGNEPAP